MRQAKQRRSIRARTWREIIDTPLESTVVSVKQSANGIESVQQMQESSGQKSTKVLPSMPCGIHEEESSDSFAINGRGAEESQRAGLCERIQEAGQADSATMQDLQQPRIRDASSGLRSANFGRVDMPPMSHGVASASAGIDTEIPTDWVKGQLLNVRHGGPGYRITILGEEWDFRHPERCLEFSNTFECQQFISTWYARQSHDPRA
jgi:hypothetical protein